MKKTHKPWNLCLGEDRFSYTLFCYVHRHNYGSHSCIGFQRWNWFPVSAFRKASFSAEAGHLRLHSEITQVARQAHAPVNQYVESERIVW